MVNRWKLCVSLTPPVWMLPTSPVQLPDVTPVQPALSPQPTPTASQVTCMLRPPELSGLSQFPPQVSYLRGCIVPYQHAAVIVFVDVTVGSIHHSITFFSLLSILVKER